MSSKEGTNPPAGGEEVEVKDPSDEFNRVMGEGESAVPMSDEAPSEAVLEVPEAKLEADAQEQGPAEDCETTQEDLVVPAEDGESDEVLADREKSKGEISLIYKPGVLKDFCADHANLLTAWMLIIFVFVANWLVTGAKTEKPMITHEAAKTASEEVVVQVTEISDDSEVASMMVAQTQPVDLEWDMYARHPEYAPEELYSIFLALKSPHCDVMEQGVAWFDKMSGKVHKPSGDTYAAVTPATKRAREMKAECPKSPVVARLFPPPPPPTPKAKPKPRPEATPVAKKDARRTTSDGFTDADRQTIGRTEKRVKSLQDQIDELKKRIARLETFHVDEEPMVCPDDDPCRDMCNKKGYSACLVAYREELERQAAAASSDAARQQEEEKRLAALAAQRDKEVQEARAAEAERQRLAKLAAEEDLRRQEEERRKREAAEAERQRLASLSEEDIRPDEPASPIASGNRQEIGGHLTANGEDIMRIFGVKQISKHPGYCYISLLVSKQDALASLTLNGEEIPRSKTAILLPKNKWHKNVPFPTPSGSSRVGDYTLVRATLDGGERLDRLFPTDGEDIALTLRFDENCGVLTP